MIHQPAGYPFTGLGVPAAWDCCNLIFAARRTNWRRHGRSAVSAIQWSSTVASTPLSKQEAVFLRYVPWVVLLLLVAFVGINAVSPDDTSRLGGSRGWVLSALLTCTAVWFIVCFTGDAASRQNHSFVFAYAFTFGAFALLVTPFVGSDDVVTARSSKTTKPPPVWPREGVLQLVRGCVRAESGTGTDAVSAVIRCPDYPLVTTAVAPGLSYFL